MGLLERAKEFTNYKSLTAKQFEQIVGLSNGAFSKLSDSIRKSTVDRISNAFPDLNTNWLLTGEGEMIKSSCDGVSQNSSNTRPRIPYDAAKRHTHRNSRGCGGVSMRTGSYNRSFPQI